jgi:hypothetical protein
MLKYLYLKIDLSYEVPIQVLVKAKDKLGNALIVWPKHQGELGELRDHVRRRDWIRGQEKLYRTTEKQSEEEDGV